MKPVRLAIVDDSKFIREALQKVLAGEDRIAIVGSASTGEELLENLGRWRPDVITLDLEMPGMGGLATLDQIMAGRPTPVIILSTRSGEGAPQTIDALSRGAADFIDKGAYSLVDFGALRGVLTDKVLGLMGRAPAEPSVRGAAAKPAPASPSTTRAAPTSGTCELIVVGSSTGGPGVIERILRDLGAEAPAPMVVVQHMPEGFTKAFAARLNRLLPLAVTEAVDREPLARGTVLIAPAGRHIRVARGRRGLRVELDDSASDEPHCPSVDVLFKSAAPVAGDATIAILLTGMGRDGAAGMAELAAAGSYTIAQSEESCVVYGMPGAAVALGAVHEVMPPERIAASICRAWKAGSTQQASG